MANILAHPFNIIKQLNLEGINSYYILPRMKPE